MPVHYLRERLPDAMLLLNAVFPRDEKPNTPFRKAIAEINSAVRPLADGTGVQWLDMTDLFLKPDGTLPAETMPDGLHLSAAAYDVWAEALAPRIAKHLGT